MRIYTTLEEMRFENDLKIVWEIETEEFMIPSLTLQPLVENAVKHGVGQSLDGGTVKICTHEEPEC